MAVSIGDRINNMPNIIPLLDLIFTAQSLKLHHISLTFCTINLVITCIALQYIITIITNFFLYLLYFLFRLNLI